MAGRPPLHYRPLWLALGWAGVVLVIYLSLTSSPLPSGEMLGVDFAHGAAYASLMFWFAQLYEGRHGRVTCAVALVAMGIALELAQGWTGYRGFSYADMRDDAIGVALGWWLATTPLSRMLPLVDARLARVGGGR